MCVVKCKENHYLYLSAVFCEFGYISAAICVNPSFINIKLRMPADGYKIDLKNIKKTNVDGGYEKVSSFSFDASPVGRSALL